MQSVQRKFAPQIAVRVAQHRMHIDVIEPVLVAQRAQQRIDADDLVVVGKREQFLRHKDFGLRIDRIERLDDDARVGRALPNRIEHIAQVRNNPFRIAAPAQVVGAAEHDERLRLQRQRVIVQTRRHVVGRIAGNAAVDQSFRVVITLQIVHLGQRISEKDNAAVRCFAIHFVKSLGFAFAYGYAAEQCQTVYVERLKRNRKSADPDGNHGQNQ